MADIAAAVEATSPRPRQTLVNEGPGADWISQPAPVESALKSATLDQARDKPAIPADALRHEATEVTVTVGPETYSPVKYNALTVGPVSARVVARPGESAGDLYCRAAAVAQAMFECEYKIALGRFFANLRNSAEAASRQVPNR